MTNDYCSTCRTRDFMYDTMLPVAMIVTVGVSTIVTQQIYSAQLDAKRPIPLVSDNNQYGSVAMTSHLGSYRTEPNSSFDYSVLNNYKMNFPEESVLVRVISDDEYIVDFKAIIEELEG